MVLARRDGVRSASRVVTIKTTSHKTVVFPVRPSLVRLTSVAAHATQASEATAASNQLLSRDAGVFTLGNAPPVSDGFSGTKSPARTARGLVSDLGNGGALGTPLLSGIKAVWDCHGDGDVPLGERDCVWLGTAKPLGLLESHLSETGRKLGLPCCGSRVDVVHQVGGNSGEVVRRHAHTDE